MANIIQGKILETKKGSFVIDEAATANITTANSNVTAVIISGETAPRRVDTTDGDKITVGTFLVSADTTLKKPVPDGTKDLLDAIVYLAKKLDTEDNPATVSDNCTLIECDNNGNKYKMLPFDVVFYNNKNFVYKYANTKKAEEIEDANIFKNQFVISAYINNAKSYRIIESASSVDELAEAVLKNNKF